MYAEIRHDYISGPAVEGGGNNQYQDLFARVSIDAWKTDSDDEEGVVLAAVIMTQHGDLYVEYHDNGCRMDEQVLEAIDAAMSDLRALWAKHHSNTEQYNGAIVNITRNGYATVPGKTVGEIMDNIKNLSEGDFDWEDFSEDMLMDSSIVEYLHAASS